MQEPGVSRLVSVRFNAREAAASQAAKPTIGCVLCCHPGRPQPGIMIAFGLML